MKDAKKASSSIKISAKLRKMKDFQQKTSKNFCYFLGFVSNTWKKKKVKLKNHLK